MYVTKRNGTKEPVQFDKITERIRKLLLEFPNDIDPIRITQQICSRIYNGINTSELDELASQLCITMITEHPTYGILASRIVVSNHQKNTKNSFKDVVNILFNNEDANGEKSPLVSDELVEISSKYENEIENILKYERDYDIDFFGFKTLCGAYLLRVNKNIIERPQHLFMRVAIGIHGNDMKSVKETYDYMSTKQFIHATPTLFHAGTPRPQMSSCFLIGTEDSVEGIYETITDCALISKWAGGIGNHIYNVRARGSYIRKTGGYSEGILPMLKVYDATAKYINQSGKRNGSFAMYLTPWHADIVEFLEAKKNSGEENARARNLFYALWISDLFMERVEKDEIWSLMCPDQCPKLIDSYGEEFEKYYTEYENNGKYIKQVKARDIWKCIIDSQIETGTPYMLYKDACNLKSNQKNVGVIKSSNLCTEIIQYSDAEEVAVCNLASICLPSVLEYPKCTYESFKIYTKPDCNYCKLLKGLLRDINVKYTEITKEEAEQHIEELGLNMFTTVPQVFGIDDWSIITYIGGYLDMWNIFKPVINTDKLQKLSYTLTINLNKIIDKNFYPLEKAEKSNMKHRPIGIGVQGLADVFIMMKIPFDSNEARLINKEIFEHIYYGAMSASIDLAEKYGAYETFNGSPLSKGQFQFDLWNVSPTLNWNPLRQKIMKVGVRNSLLIAPMPTASTSQIMGNNECIEPYTSNMYIRKTIAGEFKVINKHLIKDLIYLGLWTDDIKNRIIYDRGSVQNIKELPIFIKNVYKTVWEISQKSCLEMSADRGPFICQSQSLNLWIANPTFNILTNAHMYGWKLGLKTGSYYVRSLSAINPQRFTMDPKLEKQYEQECLSCSA